MARIDVMVDIETLGTDANAFTFQIAACAFDINTGETISTFNFALDMKKINSVEINGETLMWWLNTNKELLHKLLTEGTLTSEEQLFRSFVAWFEELPAQSADKYLWGNGILFDNNIIRTHCHRYHIQYPVRYRNDRDMRTLLELASIKTGVAETDLKDMYGAKDVVAHDAFDDVRNQISIVSACYKLLV